MDLTGARDGAPGAHAHRDPAGARLDPAGERLVDPAARLERARALAWRVLNRRDRSECELRAILAQKRVAPDQAEVVLGELLAGGFVDDRAFAQRFAEDRRRLDAWGAERIGRRLRAFGIAPELIAAALEARDDDGELEAAVALLERRCPAVPQTPRERDRALGMLVRKGYELELAYAALRRHAGVDELS